MTSLIVGTSFVGRNTLNCLNAIKTRTIAECLDQDGVYPYYVYIAAVLSGLNVTIAEEFFNDEETLHASIANGAVHTVIQPHHVDLEKWETVSYSTPFIEAVHYALIRRRNASGDTVSLSRITAHIGGYIYLSMALVVIYMIVFSKVNTTGSSTLWSTIHSMMPGSNTGAVRVENRMSSKVGAITGGLATFTMFTLYQAMLLQSLMVEKPLMPLSYDDVGAMIESERLNPILRYSNDVLETEETSSLLKLQSAFMNHPPIVETNQTRVLYEVTHNRGIYFQRLNIIMDVLQELSHSFECDDYEIIDFTRHPGVLRQWLAMILPKNHTVLVDQINLRIAERFGYFSEIDRVYDRSLLCQNMLEVKENGMQFVPIAVESVVTLFVVFGVLLGVAVVTFIVEKLIDRPYIESDKEFVRPSISLRIQGTSEDRINQFCDVINQLVVDEFYELDVQWANF